MKDRARENSRGKYGGYRTSALLAGILAALYSAEASAQSIIKQPGNHPHYSVDLEPHLAVGLDDPGYWGGTGWGLGMRATIPFLRNGPISTINNDMGIGFGLDWLTRSGSCGRYYPGYPYSNYDCSGYAFYLPVVLQWNFYLTDIITVYGEPGLAFRFAHASYTYPCGPGLVCEDSAGHTDPILVLGGGAKFMFGRTIGLNVRLGYPYVSVGASFLL